MPNITRIGRGEDGALLVVSMLTLTLLTFIGISATQLSRLETDMAVNERANKEALYASEFGLGIGESAVEHWQSRVDLNEETTPGHYAQGSGSTWHDLAWNTGDSQQVQLATTPPGLTHVALAPRYTIVEREFIADSLTRGIRNPPTGRYLFTVTARGTGSNRAAQVFLQTVYNKRYN